MTDVDVLTSREMRAQPERECVPFTSMIRGLRSAQRERAMQCAARAKIMLMRARKMRARYEAKSANRRAFNVRRMQDR